MWAQTLSLLRFRYHTQIHHNRYDNSEWVIDNTHLPLARFKPAVSANEPPKTRALDGACVQWDRTKNYTYIGKYGERWECLETDGAVSARCLAVTMNVSDRSFRVSTGVSLHPPSRSSPDRTGVAGERFRRSDRFRSLIPDSYGQG